ncbi:hypothetical protein JOL62DRAFT_381295 [Phyllosticta paracitricarpa]|uniref:Uncharacterized protein n=1 Tax=Phyllosticta paracitricarpa TaxID=2016321 RepID=A0ABR1NFH0_9PEZI
MAICPRRALLDSQHCQRHEHVFAFFSNSCLGGKATGKMWDEQRTNSSNAWARRAIGWEARFRLTGILLDTTCAEASGNSAGTWNASSRDSASILLGVGTSDSLNPDFPGAGCSLSQHSSGLSRIISTRKPPTTAQMATTRHHSPKSKTCHRLLQTSALPTSFQTDSTPSLPAYEASSRIHKPPTSPPSPCGYRTQSSNSAKATRSWTASPWSLPSSLPTC